MPEAVRLTRDRPNGSFSFDLLTPVSLDSPTFDHRVAGRWIITNNIAGYLSGTAATAVFVGDEVMSRFSATADCLNACEVAVLERAAAVFGSNLPGKLADSADDLCFRRTQRLELLRCIAVQMSRHPSLASIGAALEASVVSRGDHSLKRTGIAL